MRSDDDTEEGPTMLIDCDTCVGRGVHCHDCVVTVLLSNPVRRPSAHQPAHPGPRDRQQRDLQERFELDGEEQIALVRLAEAGLVPPLRLVSEADAEGDAARGIA